jgi:hypothetical protein
MAQAAGHIRVSDRPQTRNTPQTADVAICTLSAVWGQQNLSWEGTTGDKFKEYGCNGISKPAIIAMSPLATRR